MSKHDGGTAFPMQDGSAIHAYASAAIQDIKDPEERDTAYLKARGEAVAGMSLRDYFAAQALQGICSHHDTWGLPTSPKIASKAYELADAMIRERDL